MLIVYDVIFQKITWETNHTWAIAKSYDDATTILQKLVGNWGSLENSPSPERDGREW